MHISKSMISVKIKLELYFMNNLQLIMQQIIILWMI